MIFAEYYTNAAKKKKKETKKKKRKAGRGSNTILSYHCWGMELQNMCIRSFFRVVCYFWTGDGSGSESYAKQKEKKNNIMGPCTKPAYTGKGFCFRVFHRTNVFSINSSFFRLFVRPVSHFGPRYSNERKSQSETKKPHVPQLITKSPTKLKDVCK